MSLTQRMVKVAWLNSGARSGWRKQKAVRGSPVKHPRQENYGQRGLEADSSRWRCPLALWEGWRLGSDGGVSPLMFTGRSWNPTWEENMVRGGLVRDAGAVPGGMLRDVGAVFEVGLLGWMYCLDCAGWILIYSSGTFNNKSVVSLSEELRETEGRGHLQSCAEEASRRWPHLYSNHNSSMMNVSISIYFQSLSLSLYVRVYMSQKEKICHTSPNHILH